MFKLGLIYLRLALDKTEVVKKKAVAFNCLDVETRIEMSSAFSNEDDANILSKRIAQF